MGYATLEEIQKASMDMLLEFHKFCEEHGILYFLSYGTALGAVRHKGFIPWDDDTDVDMHVNDIEKLIKQWDLYGDKNTYFLQTKQTDPNVPRPFIRIRKNKTTSIDKGYEHIPMHWGLPLDIFPVYNYPDNKCAAKKMEKLYMFAFRTSNISFYHYHLPKLIRSIGVLLCIWTLRRLKSISDKAADSEFLMRTNSEQVIELVPRTVYYPVKTMIFEGHSFFGMNQVEKYLEMVYGDYMTLPPVEKRKTHGGFVDLKNDYSKYMK